jgi:hypothetical protein
MWSSRILEVQGSKSGRPDNESNKSLRQASSQHGMLEASASSQHGMLEASASSQRGMLEASKILQAPGGFHVIAFWGPGCSGSTWVTKMLLNLMKHNGIVPCPIGGEILKNGNFNRKNIPNADPSKNRVAQIIEHCRSDHNATGVVIDVSFPYESDHIREYEKGQVRGLREYEEGYVRELREYEKDQVREYEAYHVTVRELQEYEADHVRELEYTEEDQVRELREYEADLDQVRELREYTEADHVREYTEADHARELTEEDQIRKLTEADPGADPVADRRLAAHTTTAFGAKFKTADNFGTGIPAAEPIIAHNDTTSAHTSAHTSESRVTSDSRVTPDRVKTSDRVKIYKFSMYRANLLYRKICVILDQAVFPSKTNSYTVLRDGTRHDMKFKESRKRSDDIQVHLHVPELIQYFHFWPALGPPPALKQFAPAFTMEELSAYEYGTQFALESALKWKEVADLVGLRFNGFFQKYMKKDVNSRKLRDTRDMVF